MECRATAADIVFIVDSSGSIGSENFDKLKVFLQNMVNGFDIDPTLTRVGLLRFNDKMEWQFKLEDLNNKLDVLRVGLMNTHSQKHGNLMATYISSDNAYKYNCKHTFIYTHFFHNCFYLFLIVLSISLNYSLA